MPLLTEISASVPPGPAGTACRHCGQPVPAAAPFGQFCCAGCAFVFRVVHEQRLDDFYKIRDDTIAPASPGVFQPRDYAWLTELQHAAEARDGTPELTLEVQGITCAGCVWLIEKSFHREPGALAIEADAQLGRLRLRWARGEFATAAWARKLQSLNYLLGPAGAEEPSRESRRLVRRIGLSTALAMNVMLFTLPTYFGMEATFAYARLFGTLSLGFATLSLLAGGGYFFHRAFGALRARVVHIDLPISVGILGAYLGSVYGWATGREEFVYFDFVSAFIVLMLVGRWAQTAAVERNRRYLLSRQLRPESVRVLGAEASSVKKPLAALQPEDRFELRAGEIVPVEARLESAAATFGMAWISGEADPRDCRAGATVPAGSVYLGQAPVQLCALQAWGDSLLAQLLREPQRDDYRHRFLERVISGYLIGIFGIATVAGLAWWFSTHDAAHTWAIVTAVLVVSCPCAIGLAFPLVDELATIALRRAGVFVREADLWPRLRRVRKLFFDKTGTLTLETPVLRNPEALTQLTPPARAALFALVQGNFHPVSQALTEELLGRGLAGPDPGAAGGRELVETPGFGVALMENGIRWSLGRPGWLGKVTVARESFGDSHDTEFACEGVVLARFHFADAARRDAVAEFAALRKMGFQLFILSGDRREKVHALARQLRLPELRCIAEVTPAGKAAWIRAKDLDDTLMLGDGANDSLAFDAAFVCGTPVVHRGVLEGKADFYYLGRQLNGIRRLFEIDAQRRRTHRWLLGFSIAYNVVAVGLAAAGHMSPLIAAILMPVSSLLNLSIVALGMRQGSEPGDHGPDDFTSHDRAP